MSVVNQMLKDLEQQQAEKRLQFDENDLEVIAAKPQGQLSKTLIIFVLLAVAVAAIGAWQFFGHKSVSLTPRVSNSVNVATSSQIANNQDERIIHSQPVEAVEIPKTQSVNSAEQGEPVLEVASTNALNTPSDKSSLAVEAIPLKTAEHVDTESVIYSEAENNSSARADNTKPEYNAAQANASSMHAVEPNRQSATAKINSQPIKEVSAAQQKSTRLEQASQWISLGDFTRAEQQLKQLLVDYTDYHAAREQLAYVYLQTQNNAAFEELLKSALEIFPQHVTYRVLLARQYAEAKNWNSVVALTSSGVPLEERLLLMRALAFQQLSQHENAVDVYVNLLREQANRGDWWIGFAVSLEALKRYRDAHQALVRAAQDPRLTQQQKQYIQAKQQTLKGLF